MIEKYPYLLTPLPNQEVELQLQQDADTAADTISGLEEALAIEKRRREDADNELMSQKQVCISVI